MPDKMIQTERIRHMEQLYDLATEAMKEQPKASAKIKEMQERLGRSHFTSFWP